MITLATALTSLRDVARSGAEAALNARDMVALSRKLNESVTSMERHARQAQILDDPALQELYHHRRGRFRTAASRLEALDLPTAVASRLSELIELEERSYLAISSGSTDPSTTLVAHGLLTEVSDAARDLLLSTEGAVYSSAEELESAADNLGSRLAWMAVAVIPIMGGMVGFGYLAIIRPLRRLGTEIRRIGEGAIDDPVRIQGPSDVRQLAGRLEDMREQLKRVEADRVRLYRHVSHELKTPLASIREGTQLLAEGLAGPLNEQQEEILNIMRSNTTLLQRRIEDLLRLSELRSGEGELNLDPIALDDLVSRLVDQHRITARSRGITFDRDLEPVQVTADAARLPAAIDNLLTNALKVSPDHGTIKVSLNRSDDRWTLGVIDEGPGIDPAERERVFEPFYQGSRTRQEYIQGTGIGLTIAREIARAHGGDLVLDNNQGVPGVTALLTAPLAPRENPR